MHKITLFFCPLYLVLLEWLQRRLLAIDDALTFAGPALAAIGIGLLIPLTEGRVRTVTIVDPHTYQVEETEVCSKTEVRDVNISWVVFLMLLVIWLISIFFTLKRPNEYFKGIPIYLLLGVASYFFAILFSVWRGRNNV